MNYISKNGEKILPVFSISFSNNNHLQVGQVGGIYCIYNNTNAKVYIGSSKNCKNRFYCHLHDLRAKSHNNEHLQRAFDKHNDWYFILLEVTNDLLFAEDKWINLYDSMDAAYGYNIIPAARHQVPKSVREKISLSLSKPISMYSKCGDLIEKFDSISKAHEKFGFNTGHITSCCKGKRKSAHGYLWTYDGEEINNKVEIYSNKCKHSVLAKIKRAENYGKKVGQFKDNQLLETFITIREAAKQLNINHCQISRCCHGKTKYKTAGGFEWRFI